MWQWARWGLIALALLGSWIARDQGFLVGAAQAPGHAEHVPSEGKAQGKAPRAKPRAASATQGAFASPQACERVLSGRRPSQAARPPRIGTWNVRWFPQGSASGSNEDLQTDVAWLACAIAWIEVDLLAIQEWLDHPRARSATLDLIERLDALTGGRFRFELDDCPGGGRQHVGFLWNERRVELRQVRSIAELNPAGSACAASLRPGFAAHARFSNGLDAHVIALHLDSGQTARDFGRRAASVSTLADVVARLRASDPDVIVLGDFNVMGCSGCEPSVPAAQELEALDRGLAGAGLGRLSAAEDAACSHYYRGRPGLLDAIALSPDLHRRVGAARTEGVCAALACRRPAPGENPLALRRLSDHCPVVADLDSPTARR